MDLTFKGINIDQLSTLLPIIGAQISKPHFQGLHQKVGAILALDKQKTNHAIIDFIDSVCSYTPATGSEYIVYAAISSAIQLLDVASFTHQQKLMNHTFHKWFRDNSLFSEFATLAAEAIYSVSSETANIVHLACKISFYNDLTKEIAVVLLWAGLTDLKPSKSKKVFGLYPFTKIMEIAKMIDDSTPMEFVYKFVLLYSSYQSMMLVKQTVDLNGADRKFFTADGNDLKELRTIFTALTRKLNKKVQNDASQPNYIITIHLIDYEIIKCLDNLIESAEAEPGIDSSGIF